MMGSSERSIVRVVIAPDSFKGSLAAEDVADAIAAEWEAQQEFIAKEEDFIRRNMAGQNTRQAQGRLKRLERLLEDEGNELPARMKRRYQKLLAVPGEISTDLTTYTKDPAPIEKHRDKVARAIEALLAR